MFILSLHAFPQGDKKEQKIFQINIFIFDFETKK